jgi:DNA-binding Lrp family transcriptional regulator
MTRKNDLKPFKNMWTNKISVVDLQICYLLLQGHGTSTLDIHFEKDLGYPKGAFTRPYLTNRVEELKKQEIILKENAVIVNPIKFFDYIFLTFVKIHLPAVRGTIDWAGAFEDVKKLNKDYGCLSMAFTVEGMGDYDLVLLIFTNDIDTYYDFVDDLTRCGWVEKVDGKKVHSAKRAGFFYEPVLLPNNDEYDESVREYHKRLGEMIEETDVRKSK